MIFSRLRQAKNQAKLRTIVTAAPRVAGKTLTLGFQVIGVGLYLADRALDKALNAGKDTIDNWNADDPQQLELEFEDKQD